MEDGGRRTETHFCNHKYFLLQLKGCLINSQIVKTIYTICHHDLGKVSKIAKVA